MPCRVVVCRDCCRGGPGATGADHAARTERLRAAAPVCVSDRLDVCDRADAVVVRPSAEGRTTGARPVRPIQPARPVRPGPVDDPDATGDVVAGTRAGGPGGRTVHAPPLRTADAR
ncbi:(2Fe-2S) ferredoxin domain-containing protein [Streptomyces sp. NPDC018955]|uniref:(2Fe-2S) ferredoxin domain-containing protein n=1 Tax=Streptomyces sp. NPDC018955 TaxID=3365055 RepID=UPI0037A8D324